MNISLEKAAQTLGITQDELMFKAQNENKVQVGIDEDTMTWTFDFDEILSLKEDLEQREENNE